MSVSSKRKKDLIFVDMQISQSLSFDEFKLFTLISLITFPKHFFNFEKVRLTNKLLYILIFGCEVVYHVWLEMCPILPQTTLSHCSGRGSGTWRRRHSLKQLALGTAPSLPCCSQSTLHPLRLVLGSLNNWMNCTVTKFPSWQPKNMRVL